SGSTGQRMMSATCTNGPGTYFTSMRERAHSRIDPQNLEQIAQELGVEYQHRSADVPIELPPAPTTVTSADGSTESIRELSWIVALVIAALLAIELAFASALLAGTARVPRGRRGETP